MCAFHYTTKELVSCGLHVNTVQIHARKKWLRGEKVSDVIGWRFPEDNVRRWAEKYLKGPAKDGVLAMLGVERPNIAAKQAGVWMVEAYEKEKVGHLLLPGDKTPCNLKGTIWQSAPEGVRKCTRCQGHENKKGKK
jgi:hypothetical protein